MQEDHVKRVSHQDPVGLDFENLVESVSNEVDNLIILSDNLLLIALNSLLAH